MRLRRGTSARPDPPSAGRSSCDGGAAEDCEHTRRLRLEMLEHRRQRERRQLLQHQQEMAELVVDLLEGLDTVDAAARHQITGADQLHRQLHRVLSRYGIERLDGDEQPFDPTVHQAVRHEPGAGPSMVVDLLRPGYRWNGRVLRPALVAVRG